MSKSKKGSQGLRSGEVRNRVVEVVSLRPDELRDHPMNWRTHDAHQLGALEGSLKEIGWAGNVYARRVVSESERFVREGKLSVGDVCTLDGHGRRKTLPKDFAMTVTILDLTEDEGIKFLAVYDPISALAGQDDTKLAEVLSNMTTSSPDIEAMLASLYKLPEEREDDKPEDESGDKPEVKYQILITCADEGDQTALLEELMERGVACKSMIG